MLKNLMSSTLSNINKFAARKQSNLEERLNQHPELKDKIESLLSVVENAQGEIKTADEAEKRFIEEIQKIGQTALEGWATRENEEKRKKFQQEHPKTSRSRKKNCTGIADSER